MQESLRISILNYNMKWVCVLITFEQMAQSKTNTGMEKLNSQVWLGLTRNWESGSVYWDPNRKPYKLITLTTNKKIGRGGMANTRTME